ncbi:MAG TPA: DUF4296 domain-containing protein [Flavobacterium sp.]|jgi:hypothetical protein
MKKGIFYLMAIFLGTACNEAIADKPAHLIDEDKMVDIIYDMSLLEAIKVANPNSLAERGIDLKTYIYKKYKIDSTQFAQSDKYYASDIDTYGNIYEKVSKRIEAVKSEADTLLKKKLQDTTKIKATLKGDQPVEVKAIKN